MSISSFRLLLIGGFLISFTLFVSLLVYVADAYKQGDFSMAQVLTFVLVCAYVVATVIFINHKKDQLFGEFGSADTRRKQSV